MQLVPLRSLGILERQTCFNWCSQTIGPEGALTWFGVEPSNDGRGHNLERYESFQKNGLLYGIIFHKDEDAVAFKLRFAL